MGCDRREVLVLLQAMHLPVSLNARFVRFVRSFVAARCGFGFCLSMLPPASNDLHSSYGTTLAQGCATQPVPAHFKPATTEVTKPHICTCTVHMLVVMQLQHSNVTLVCNL